jgi:hypothetical protein
MEVAYASEVMLQSDGRKMAGVFGSLPPMLGLRCPNGDAQWFAGFSPECFFSCC